MSNSNNSQSPIQQVRMGGSDVLSRLTALEAGYQQLLARDIAAQHLAEVTLDQGPINFSYSYAASGRLTADSVNFAPIPASDITGASAIYFVPFRGNQIAIFNGTIWNPLVIPPGVAATALKLPLSQTQNGTTSNGQPQITGLTDTSQLIAGMAVTGTGVTNGTTISSVDSPTQITMSANATAGGTVAITFAVLSNTFLHIFAIDTGGGILGLRMINAQAGTTLTVTAATTATPPVLTTATHGYSTGDIVSIEYALGETVINGVFRITVVSSTTFSLQNLQGTNIVGSGTYTASSARCRQVTNLTAPSALGQQDNIYVSASDATWRYIGSCRTSRGTSPAGGDGQINDSRTSRLLWNYYNRASRSMVTSQGAWSYNTAAWRADNNNLAIRLEWIIGVAEDSVVVFKNMPNIATSTDVYTTGIGIDKVVQTTAPQFSTQLGGVVAQMSMFTNGAIDAGSSPAMAAGYHWAQGQEFDSSGGTTMANSGEVISALLFT